MPDQSSASIFPSILVAYPMPSQNIQPHIITFPPPNFTVLSISLSIKGSPTSFHTHFLPSDPRRLILVSSVHTTLFQSSIVYSLHLSAHCNLSLLWRADRRGRFLFTTGCKPISFKLRRTV